MAGEAPDGLAAVSQAAELRPDVVVMDVRMPWLNGIEATRRLVALTPRPPRVVLLTTFDLRDRAHAVVYGYETGLVRPGEAGAQQTWPSGTG